LPSPAPASTGAPVLLLPQPRPYTKQAPKKPKQRPAHRLVDIISLLLTAALGRCPAQTRTRKATFLFKKQYVSSIQSSEQSAVFSSKRHGKCASCPRGSSSKPCRLPPKARGFAAPFGRD